MNFNLKPPDDFLSPLLELRDYYARSVEEYENLYRQAQQQLGHVEALLSNWNSLNNNQTPKLTLVDQTPHSQQSSLVFLSPHDDIFNIDLTDESTKSELDEQESDNDSNGTYTQLSLPVTAQADNSDKVLEIPMLRQYENLSRMEAIKLLLQDYLGTVCHIDFIVLKLYGELDPKVFRIVKGRVQSSLTQGRERDYWSAMPGEPGCYTLDLGLVASSNASSSRPKFKKKKSFIPPQAKIVPMLQEFEGQFLIDALTDFMEQNPGKVFNVAEVIAAIYGELDNEDLREVKNKVLNELSRGHRIGRFTRVPNQIGVYTWDDKLIGK